MRRKGCEGGKKMNYNTPELEVILFETQVDTIIESTGYNPSGEPETGTPETWG